MEEFEVKEKVNCLAELRSVTESSLGWLAKFEDYDKKSKFSTEIPATDEISFNNVAEDSSKPSCNDMD